MRAQRLTDEEHAAIRELFLLTDKPVLYVANVDEGQLARTTRTRACRRCEAMADEGGRRGGRARRGKSRRRSSSCPRRSGRASCESAGLSEPGLQQGRARRLPLLGLQTYFTVGEQECRAWTVHQGARAPQAAGVIHTDFERGFIKAEVMRVDDLLRLGSEAAVKEKGLLRVEGKEYVVQDGDVHALPVQRVMPFALRLRRATRAYAQGERCWLPLALSVARSA